jgi:penicillin G amidase
MSMRYGLRMTPTIRRSFVLPGAICLAAASLLTGCITEGDRASLAQLEGPAALPELERPAVVERDEIGATRYIAGSLEDAARAQGYVHAQERLAQMDASRRFACGRLAELVGAPGLPNDRGMRRVGFHMAAERALERLPARHRRLLEAYAEGVNAGAAALGAAPPEYRLLGTEPAPWSAIDSIHVAYAMSSLLLTGAESEPKLAALHEAYAEQPEMIRFLLPEATRFDRLLNLPSDYEPLPVPERPSERAGGATARAAYDLPRASLGSNSWAVAGSRTADGRAILAGDMHLSLTVPPIWRHEHLIWDEAGEERFAVGVALPGVPGIIAGSNGRIAWAFTNVTGDFADHAVIEPDPERPDRYLAPGGSLEFTQRSETIPIRGKTSATLVVRETAWGPIVGEDHRRRPLALRRGDLAEPINVDLLDLLTADSLEEGIEIARGWRGPPQNVTLASADGRIAWTVSGFIPERPEGATGRVPLEFAAGERWLGELPERKRPEQVDPASGLIYTANNRLLPLPAARRLGTLWELGARAARISERLESARTPITERDLLDIQLDTRARVYEAFVPHLLGAIEENDPDRRLRYARGVIERWGGNAEAEDREYRLVRWSSLTVIREAMAPLLAPAAERWPQWRAGSPLAYVEPALRLLEERPEAYVPEPHGTWRDFLRASMLQAMDEIRATRENPRLDAPWGERNRLAMRHPLSQALPWLRARLDLPDDPQPGDVVTVRVASPGIGASQRMVVSPGREADGVFHMPGGQSGHPLSPFYRAGHEAWAQGRPRPLLPGPTVHRLTLEPAGPSGN